ncbi:unnamed protein product [Closterium sp. NIES-64]|nr:unnamed protein product [Closterium sp. NIES-64]
MRPFRPPVAAAAAAAARGGLAVSTGEWRQREVSTGEWRQREVSTGEWRQREVSTGEWRQREVRRERACREGGGTMGREEERCSERRERCKLTPLSASSSSSSPPFRLSPQLHTFFPLSSQLPIPLYPISPVPLQAV